MTESFLKSAGSLHAKQNYTGCQHGNVAEAWEVVIFFGKKPQAAEEQ